MKSETIYRRDLKWVFIYPFFTPETKKEEKASERMNKFFCRMGELVEKYADSDAFPEGGKFAAECQHSDASDDTLCVFSLKRRGRLISRRKISYTWHNGYIKKSNIM